MFSKIYAMLAKEFTQIIKDKNMRAVVIIIPIIQTILIGYAITMDIKHIRLAVVDEDNSPISRDFVSSFQSNDIFKVVDSLDIKGAEEAMLNGKIDMILSINKGFTKKVDNGEITKIQVVLDASNSMKAATESGYIIRIIELFNNNLKYDFIQKKDGLIKLDIRNWFNEYSESKLFFVPSIPAMLLLILTTILSSMAIVGEKERGTMEQLIVSPLSRSEFIIGKTIPFAIVSLLMFAFITVITVFYFGILPNGSIPLLLLSTSIYILCVLGMGLIVSSISNTQQQAMLGSFMVIFPLILLSGFAFPIENMPPSVQYLTYLNPMRYYVTILRGVYMKGLGINTLQFELFMLIMLSLAYLIGAVKLFKKNLD